MQRTRKSAEDRAILSALSLELGFLSLSNRLTIRIGFRAARRPARARNHAALVVYTASRHAFVPSFPNGETSDRRIAPHARRRAAVRSLVCATRKQHRETREKAQGSGWRAARPPVRGTGCRACLCRGLRTACGPARSSQCRGPRAARPHAARFLHFSAAVCGRKLRKTAQKGHRAMPLFGASSRTARSRTAGRHSSRRGAGPRPARGAARGGAAHMRRGAAPCRKSASVHCRRANVAAPGPSESCWAAADSQLEAAIAWTRMSDSGERLG
jgi:hypothetical protein